MPGSAVTHASLFRSTSMSLTCSLPTDRPTSVRPMAVNERQSTAQTSPTWVVPRPESGRSMPAAFRLGARSPFGEKRAVSWRPATDNAWWHATESTPCGQPAPVVSERWHRATPAAGPVRSAGVRWRCWRQSVGFKKSRGRQSASWSDRQGTGPAAGAVAASPTGSRRTRLVSVEGLAALCANLKLKLQLARMSVLIRA